LHLPSHPFTISNNHFPKENVYNFKIESNKDILINA